MNAFTPKQRDCAMQIICDYYADENNIDPIDTEDLYRLGLKRTINATQLVDVLKAMGYVDTQSYYDDPDTIYLTDLGKVYFEQKYDESAKRRSETIRYAITTAIALAALIKSFLPEISGVLAKLLQGS